MIVRISEFTYKRLIEGLGQELPMLHSDEHGFVRVNIPSEIVRNATKNFGRDIDHALNETINHNQREGLWPKKNV